MQALDALVLELSMSIIQHPLENRTFDSVLISYAAILSWNVNQGSWMKVKDYSSLTSYLVYAVQMVILLHCFERHEGDSRWIFADLWPTSAPHGCYPTALDRWQNCWVFDCSR